jgi:hypothetical protein
MSARSSSAAKAVAPVAAALAAAIAIALASGACGTAKPGGMSGPTMDGRVQDEPPHPLQSNDILARDAVADSTAVKHILIGWRDLEASYPDGMDPRAAGRSRREAEELARQLLEQVRGGAPIEPLMAQHSEDRGSAETGRAYEVTSDASLVFEFRRMGLRLQPNEVGLVLTQFGWHIMKRVR